ncbi:lipoprotein signal peptidase [Prevotella intermedia]|jgi:signal peptidase II|uniref:Lipoprotein signal peptidase n=1 Tax=Prevotella intermedia TaxID=28131 RepID=A0A2G8I7Q1_PREIN|nr:lipoprotein signal peptidase [Prevotella intermedia]ATV34452.1 lipoprotein signal peptidase [Prevotella intermedia]ATV41462.1 lipoprotein signal peptidase [Prevotella intermedia]PIK19525.1 lipoprotein signal peptidase [Prevotella intermedia]PJI26230.1 lipoprotein signal peptidase [Prevotella intermedia]RQE06510.1 lipoprotein signal peptidase [Prevotella intermedia]
MNNKKKCTIAAAIIVLLLLIDQAIKVAVKLNMNIGEEIVVFDWFRISFIENRGMAFGMEIGSKLFLSLFRIVAVGGLTWYIWKKIKEGARMGYIVVLSMIYAGAAGNIFDSLFYGEIFTASHPYYTDLPPAQLVPWGEGYASILMGNVVDMFSFPLFHGTFPNWFPVWGGEDFTFFSAIFNFADACISVGVVVLFLFYRNDFNNIKATPPTAENIEETTENTEK